MAGEAKTSKFNIGASTVMVGPMQDLLSLTPEIHSIGLVKNFSATSTDNYLDLTQGIRNNKVWSEKVGTDNTATMEVYEYTASNLAYSLGLDGSKMLPSKNFAVATATGNSIRVFTSADDSGQTLFPGGKVSIQSSSKSDRVFVSEILTSTFTAGGIPEIGLTATVTAMITALNAQLAPNASLSVVGNRLVLSTAATAIIRFSVPMQNAFGMVDGVGNQTGTTVIQPTATLTSLGVVAEDILKIEVNDFESTLAAKTAPTTVERASYNLTLTQNIPVTMEIVAGDILRNVSFIAAGSPDPQPYLAAKVVGILPDGNTPVVLLYPKIRITAGFTLGFSTEAYGNMPFEFSPAELTAGDPNFDQFGGKGVMFAYIP
jgi:hypothetical protein